MKRAGTAKRAAGTHMERKTAVPWTTVPVLFRSFGNGTRSRSRSEERERERPFRNDLGTVDMTGFLATTGCPL